MLRVSWDFLCILDVSKSRKFLNKLLHQSQFAKQQRVLEEDAN